MRVSSLLLVVGASLLVLGVLLRFAPWLFSWFGNLPGDIRYRGARGRLFIPITSMIVVSIAVTALLNLIRFLRDR